MDKSYLLLISGKRCAGKDLVAVMLDNIFCPRTMSAHPMSVSMFNWKLDIMRLGWYPKQDYALVNGINMSRLLYDRKFKESHRSGITDLAISARNTYPDVWVNKLYRDIKTEGHHFPHIILVPDHRFPNEYDYLKEKENLVVKRLRIDIEDDVREGFDWVPSDLDMDPTETSLDGVKEWDFVVKNDGTLTNLKMEAVRLHDELIDDYGITIT